MKKFVRSVLICLPGVLSVAGGARVQSAPPAPAAAGDAATPTAPIIQQIVDHVKPSLVRIHVVEASPEEGHEIKEEAFGSGIIISPDGYVVTNHHVAGNARWLSCTLSSKDEVGAHLVGSDPLADIAVIKLDPLPSGAPYQAVLWGDSAKLRVGDAVLAMGSPLAFSQSVTAGIVSNTELIMPEMMGSMQMQGEDVGSIVRWIGHDAQIFPGNSGGPLINVAGEIVGINEIGVGLSGAIPSNIARSVAEQLIARKHVTRAYSGLDLQPLLRGAGAAAPSGVLVGGILPGSPALRGGLKPGDILLRVGGSPVNARFPEEIPLVNLQMANLTVDKPVPFDVLRAGQAVTLTITPALREPAELPSTVVKGWGITASDITPTQALEMREPVKSKGVTLTSLAIGGPAADAQPPLKEGDIFVKVGDTAVTDIESLRAVTAKLTTKTAGGASSAGVPTLVEVKREGQLILTVVALGKGAEEDTSDEVAKAWLPIDVQALTPTLVEALHLPAGTKGVRVTQIFSDGIITAGTPAETTDAAHLRVGDILTKLDGEAIEVSQPEEATSFFAMVRQYHIGAPMKVTGYRGEAPLTVALKTVRAPREERELSRYVDDEFGLTLRSVTYKDRAEKDAGPGETGALVINVAKGSWAALGGMRVDDIIQQIDGTPVKDMESAQNALKALAERAPRRVTFFVSRGIHTLYIETQTDYVLSTPPSIVAATH